MRPLRISIALGLMGGLLVLGCSTDPAVERVKPASEAPPMSSASSPSNQGDDERRAEDQHWTTIGRCPVEPAVDSITIFCDRIDEGRGSGALIAIAAPQLATANTAADKAINDDIRLRLSALRDRLKDWAQEPEHRSADDVYSVLAGSYNAPYVTDAIVSVRWTGTAFFAHTPHPVYPVLVFNYDRTTGRRLAFNDVFDTAALAPLHAEGLRQLREFNGSITGTGHVGEDWFDLYGTTVLDTDSDFEWFTIQHDTVTFAVLTANDFCKAWRWCQPEIVISRATVAQWASKPMQLNGTDR